MNNALILLSTYVITFRGLLSFLFGGENLNFFYISGFLLIFMSLNGFYYSLSAFGEGKNYQWLRILLALNLIFMSTYFLIESLFSNDSFSTIVATFIIMGLSPYCIYALGKISTKSKILYLITLTIFSSCTIIYDFYQLNLDSEAYANVINRYQNIRLSDSIEGLTKSFNFYRPLGFMGDLPHNSALINCMLSIYWFEHMVTREETSKYIILFLLSFLATVLSLVASTILAMFLGIAIVIIASYKNFISLKGIINLLLPIIISILSILSIFDIDYIYKIINAIYIRINPNTGDWVNTLDLRFGDPFADFIAFLFGHNDLIVSRMGSIEITIIGIFFHFSFLGAGIFLSILAYPLLIHRKIFSKNNPVLLVIFVSILSLWHYSSLFNTVNIVIFFVFYSLLISRSRLNFEDA